jgi:hypothetical protein
MFSLLLLYFADIVDILHENISKLLQGNSKKIHLVIKHKT